MKDSAPPQIGRYELGERIGGGGMADVYLARLKAVGNRFVALKVLRDDLAHDPQQVTMFRDEARLLAKLSHTYTVQLYETGEDGGRHYIAMELLIGESLLDVWTAYQNRKRKIPYPVVAWMGARTCEALHHAHELKDDKGNPENVVHRDVNPSNLFVTLDGRIKVIDFGLARMKTRQSRTAAGIVKGKLAYLSPEQVDGKTPDRRADLFALGTTLYELSCDCRLFRKDSDVDTVRAIQACVVPDPRETIADYPAPLWSVVKRALARDPDERYQTADALAKDLDKCVKKLGGNVGPATVAHLMAEVSAWAGK